MELRKGGRLKLEKSLAVARKQIPAHVMISVGFVWIFSLVPYRSIPACNKNMLVSAFFY
jgi:hypothetical protein